MVLTLPDLPHLSVIYWLVQDDQNPRCAVIEHIAGKYYTLWRHLNAQISSAQKKAWKSLRRLAESKPIEGGLGLASSFWGYKDVAAQVNIENIPKDNAHAPDRLMLRTSSGRGGLKSSGKLAPNNITKFTQTAKIIDELPLSSTPSLSSMITWYFPNQEITCHTQGLWSCWLDGDVIDGSGGRTADIRVVRAIFFINFLPVVLISLEYALQIFVDWFMCSGLHGHFLRVKDRQHGLLAPLCVYRQDQRQQKRRKWQL